MFLGKVLFKKKWTVLINQIAIQERNFKILLYHCEVSKSEFKLANTENYSSEEQIDQVRFLESETKAYKGFEFFLRKVLKLIKHYIRKKIWFLV